MQLLKITAALATTLFFATNAAAYDWKPDQVKDYIKMYKNLEDREGTYNFGIDNETRSDLKACQKLGEGSPKCDNICSHLQETIEKYYDSYGGDLAPWDEDQSIVGALKAAKPVCEMDTPIPGTGK